MYVRVRLLLGSDSETHYINCRSINESMDELRDKVARKWKCDNASVVRLFFDGKELNNGYTLFEYNIKVNNVIQVMIRDAEHLRTDSNHVKSGQISELKNDNRDKEQIKDIESDEEEVFVKEDDYYSIGDYVDALDSDTGAWFEARIARISSNKSGTDYKYYVNFEKESIGCDVGLSLQQIRPQSSRPMAFDELKAGQVVLANFSTDNSVQRGYWYECRIDNCSKTSKTRAIYGSVCMAGVVLERQRIRLIDEIFAIESNVKRSERSPQQQVLIRFGAKAKRRSAPDCSQCDDDSTLDCKKCSCNTCGAKTAPDKQIICDECNAIYHIWCLTTPLQTVPEDDWYCSECKNNELKKVTEIQSKQLEKRKNSLNRVGVKDWGRGMACVGRTQICHTVPRDHFGPIPGIEVGMWWRFRFQASEVGLHTPLVAGIHGKENIGAYSIVFSCSYDEDIDLGDQFYYTASGGKDSTNKCRVGGPQTKDQELKRCNKALALNCFAPFDDLKGANAGLDWQKGKPVRVLRSGNARGASKRSLYLPKVGVRYDGIYKVVKYWPQTGDSGFLVWRYLLRRDDPTPAPWTKDGINRIKRLGLTITYPEGWTEATASKRSWKMDEKAFKCKKVKTNSFTVPNHILKLISKDRQNTNLWQNVLLNAKRGKQEFLEKLELNFKCVCCLEIVTNPVTTVCSHNICKSCLDQSFMSGVNSCPICRTVIKSLKKVSINRTLNEILTQLLSL